MGRVNERMIEVYGSVKNALDAIDFFHRGAGRNLRAFLRNLEKTLADLRHGQNDLQHVSLEERAIVVQARKLSLKNLESILRIMDEGEIREEEAGDEGEDIAPKPE